MNSISLRSGCTLYISVVVQGAVKALAFGIVLMKNGHH